MGKVTFENRSVNDFQHANPLRNSEDVGSVCISKNVTRKYYNLPIKGLNRPLGAYSTCGLFVTNISQDATSLGCELSLLYVTSNGYTAAVIRIFASL